MQVVFNQSNFAQPVISVGCVFTLRVAPKKSGECLLRTVKIPCLNQAIGSFVKLLFLGRITGCHIGRRVSGWRYRVGVANDRLSALLVTETAIQGLVAVATFFGQAVNLVLLFFNHAAQCSNFLLHLLELHK